MSSDCHSPVLRVRDLDHYFNAEGPRSRSEGNRNELNDFAQTCMLQTFQKVIMSRKHAEITASQLRSLSRLSLKLKLKASKRTDTAGSRTPRDSATDEDEEVLTLQSSRSTISGRSSITSDRGRFYKLRPLERAGSSTRSVYHGPIFDSQVEPEDSQADLEDLYSSAGHTPFAATPSRMSISTATSKDTPAMELKAMS